MKTILISRCAVNLLTHGRIGILLAVLTIYVLIPFSAYPAETVSPEVEKAILDENWKGIVQLMPDIETNGASATLRLIKGNACLALNENNESLCLFMGASSKTDQLGYQAWASSFANRNADKGIAHYFEGDAFARQTNWAAAISAFDAAIKISPNAALALNGRGVVHARQNDIILAKQDFLEAIRTSEESLADAYNNVGYLWIQRKDGAKGALASFQKAIERNPHFALALHGKGCIELVTQDNDAAAIDLKAAYASGNTCIDLMQENEARYAAFATGHDPQQFVAQLNNPGMTLRTRTDVGGELDHAASDFRTSSALERMTQLPFNHDMAKLFANWGGEHLGNAYAMGGDASVKNFQVQHPAEAQVALQQAQHPLDADLKIRTESFRVAGNAVQSGGGDLGKTIAQGLTWGLFAKADALTARDASRSLNQPALLKNLSATPMPGSTTYNPGGVLVKINLQDGNWPFIPVYGLVYRQQK